MTIELRKPGTIEPVAPSAVVKAERVRQYLVARRVAAVAITRRQAWTAWRYLKQAPTVGFLLLFVYSWRGAWRTTAMLARYVTDTESAVLRTQHATGGESKEYSAVSAVRSANLAARARVVASLAGVVLTLVLAWTAPDALAWIAAVTTFVATIKLLPMRAWQELLVAAGAGGLVYFLVQIGAPHVPRPPTWLLTVAAVGIVVGLGWAGRPIARPLVRLDPSSEHGLPPKPTAAVVVEALCRAGIPGMTLATAERVHAETRVIAPGVATSQHGYIVELELPPGVTVDMVVKQRAPLAAALRRDLSTVWPSGSPERHPGYLRLFLSHRPMNKARQPAWPVAAGRARSYFDDIELITNEQMEWVSIALAGTHAAVGGASGSGKSVGLRQLGIALAFAVDTHLVVFDGKRSGDLEPIRDLCMALPGGGTAYFEGAEPEDVEPQLAFLRWLVAEQKRRARFLGSLPRSENRQSKVTRELAAKYPKELGPIVVLFDEVQEYTEYGVKGNKQDKKVRDEFVSLLTKLARLIRAYGASIVFVSQKPDATVLPSAIMGNCGIRIAFRVLEQVHNDQILGTSARKNGIDATMFTLQDRGMAWVRGSETADTVVGRTSSEMVNLDAADELAALAYVLRKAAGMLPDQGEEIAIVVLDEVQDLVAEMTARGRESAHLRDAAEWLAGRQPEYSTLDAGALGARLRERGVPTPQVTIGGRTTTGIRVGDLREHLADPWVDPTNSEGS